MQEDVPIEITEDELIYLSEQLEPLNHTHEKSAVSHFVLLKKRSNLKKIIHLVFQNELSDVERQVAYPYFIENKTIAEIARTLSLTRRQADRIKDTAEQKLYSFLKYPMLMRFSLLCPPANFLKDVQEDLCMK